MSPDLFSHISTVPTERTALLTDGRDLSFGELTDAAKILRENIPAGCRIAVISSNLAEALSLVIAADGLASAILLTSDGFPDDVKCQLLSTFQPDVLLGDLKTGQSAGVEVAETAAALAPKLGKISPKETGPTDWVLTTSGTTGIPKLVQHSLLSLTRTTKTSISRGSDQVWGLLYDYSRFAGLQVVLQSLLSGASLVAPNLDASLPEQITMLLRKGTTHLSATPTQWRKILMVPDHSKLCLRQITLGGEISNSQILAGVSKCWPNARVSHIFASTEAGVGFSVTDGKAGFPSSYLTDPPAGIGLRVKENRLYVRNTKVGSHYLGANEKKLSEEGWVDTGDTIEEVDGRIYFRGRASGVINVGGNKVHPEEVERVLLGHPEVALARVFAKSNPITGALVAAEIVLISNADHADVRKSVQQHARNQLERYMVPAMIKIVPGFDTNVAGKIKR